MMGALALTVAALIFKGYNYAGNIIFLWNNCYNFFR
jgi:hypothetical protein